jgi:hypothetical protein
MTVDHLTIELQLAENRRDSVEDGPHRGISGYVRSVIIEASIRPQAPLKVVCPAPGASRAREPATHEKLVRPRQPHDLPLEARRPVSAHLRARFF